MHKLGVHVADGESMDPSAIALEGLHHADLQLDQAVAELHRLARVLTGMWMGWIRSAEFVARMTARMMLAATLATLKTAGEMQKSLIDIRG